jgi:hypothetical protein
MNSYTRTRTDEIKRDILNLSDDKFEGDTEKVDAMTEIETHLHDCMTVHGWTPPAPGRRKE